MCTLSHHSNTKPPSLLATLYLWERTSLPPIYKRPDQWGVTFIPMVAETLGCLSEDSINTIRVPVPSELLSAGQRVNSPSSCSKQLFHRLAIALWRGNACLWLHREHALPPSVDGITYALLPLVHNEPNLLIIISIIIMYYATFVL